MTGYFHRMATRTGLVQPAGDRKDAADSPVAPLEVHDLHLVTASTRRDPALAPRDSGTGEALPRHANTDLEAPPLAVRRTADDTDRPDGAGPIPMQHTATPPGTPERTEDAVGTPVAAPPAPRQEPAPAPLADLDAATPTGRSETPKPLALARTDLAMGTFEPVRSSQATRTPAMAAEAIQELSEQISAEAARSARIEALPESPVRPVRRPPSAELPEVSDPAAAAARPRDTGPDSRTLPRAVPVMADFAPRPAIPVPRNRDQAPSIRIGHIQVEVHGPKTEPEPQAPVPPAPESPPRPPAMRRFYVRA